MGDPAVKLDERFTYKEYRTWSEDERWELIRGEPFRMQAPTTVHQSLLLDLATELNQWFKGKPCKPFIAPVDVLLRERPDQPEDEVDTIVEPDLIVVCDPEKIRRNGIQGAPDWVLEILSPSTSWRDQTEKRMLYERHGVKEYWILNPDTFDLLIYRLAAGRFGAPEGASLRHPVALGLFPGLVVSGHADPEEP